MVTHDKFCLIRHCQVQLRWSRQPYRFRPRKSDDLLDETSHREGSHETPLADTTAIPANGGRGTAMGSGVSIPTALDDTSRTVRRALAISHTTDGGDTGALRSMAGYRPNGRLWPKPLTSRSNVSPHTCLRKARPYVQRIASVMMGRVAPRSADQDSTACGTGSTRARATGY
jgi:hypothetical protein